MKNIVALILALSATAAALANEISVYDLRTIGLTSPIGIEEVPYVGWKINSSDRGFRQKAYRIQVSTDKNFSGRLLWDSGKVRSDNSINARLHSDALPSASTKIYWRVKVWGMDSSESPWSLPACYVTGMKGDPDWDTAQWIAMEADGEQIVPALHAPEAQWKLQGKEVGNYRLPLIRKDFRLRRPVSAAYLFICGLGHFESFLNGSRIGNHFLDPGWTLYSKEAEYVGFDITDMVCKGDNTLGVALGNGMYNIPNERYYKFTGSYGAPKLKALVRVEYDDGSTETVTSDESWSCAPSPVTFSSIFGGEDYDARLYQKGWNRPGFNDTGWGKVVRTQCDTRLRPQAGTALAVRETFLPETARKCGDGTTVYDFGQNISGIPELFVSGRKGQRIILRPGELIDADGHVNQDASGKPFYYTYILNGDSIETWRPQFTYYGFRYIEIETDSADSPAPEIAAVRALHTSSDNAETGHFHCSNELFNRIYRLIDKAMSSNTASVLTDCPHREKLGWIEQAHLMQNSLSYRRDMRRIYEKAMADMAASQLPDGAIPTIAPEYVRFEGGFEDSPEWGAAFILCPYQAWLTYGNTDILHKYYPAMKKYMDYLASRADNHIIAYGLGDWYDIGPKEPGYSQLTSNGVTATAIYFQNALTMARIAEITGNDADATEFRKLSSEIRQAFNSRFLNSTEGYYDRNSQTANAMALVLGFPDDCVRENVARNLADDIIGRGYSLTAGDIGYRYLLKALEDNGMSDIIYTMNTGFDHPGYGWQLAHGATALTESWQAYGFVSNNHMMLGHLMEWLFGSVGGIRMDQKEGCHRLIIKPMPVGDLKFARTSITTPFGEASCHWEIAAGRRKIKVTVPPNSMAEVTLPDYDGSEVTDFGKPVSVKADGTISAGSGTYLWEY